MKRTIALGVVGVMFLMGAYALGRIDGKRSAVSGRIVVTDVCTSTMALVDTDAGVQTLSHTNGTPTGLYYNGLYYAWAQLVTVFRPDAKRVLMLGLGGGEMFKTLRRTGYAGELVGVDSADDTSDVAGTFGLEQLGVKVRVEDALHFVQTQNAYSFHSYEGVIVDLYTRESMSPEQANVRFYESIVQLLTPRGVVLVNVAHREDVKRVVAVMRKGGLLDVYAFPVQGQTNTMLLGMVKDDWGEVSFPRWMQDSVDHRWLP